MQRGYKSIHDNVNNAYNSTYINIHEWGIKKDIGIVLQIDAGRIYFITHKKGAGAVHF